MDVDFIEGIEIYFLARKEELEKEAEEKQWDLYKSLYLGMQLKQIKNISFAEFKKMFEDNKNNGNKYKSDYSHLSDEDIERELANMEVGE